MNIHYNETTGQIVSYGMGSIHDDGFGTSHFPGCKVIIIDNQIIDPKTQRIDPETLQIVAKEPDPEPDALSFVQICVAQELANTDKYVLPDFPISTEDRDSWVVYRKALRDSSKGVSTSKEQLANVPSRPDGIDIFMAFRKDQEA